MPCYSRVVNFGSTRKNEKWLFFDFVDDAVDDVFTKVPRPADRLGIISQTSKFQPLCTERERDYIGKCFKIWIEIEDFADQDWRLLQ